MSNSVHSHFGTCNMLCFFSKLPISRKVSTGFTCTSFLMWSFLMWSNLVFPLAHLNILISAEFSLFSSFFFTAQHPEPYVIAGLMIVLNTLSFNSTSIFLSHITRAGFLLRAGTRINYPAAKLRVPAAIVWMEDRFYCYLCPTRFTLIVYNV